MTVNEKTKKALATAEVSAKKPSKADLFAISLLSDASEKTICHGNARTSQEERREVFA